jgi:hypothetical protein
VGNVPTDFALAIRPVRRRVWDGATLTAVFNFANSQIGAALGPDVGCSDTLIKIGNAGQTRWPWPL